MRLTFMTENSCIGCLERKVGCHSKCEKYKKWKEEYEKVKAQAKKNEKKIYDYYYR